MNKEALKEALLEGLRVVTLAVLPLLIDAVTRWQFDWKAIVIVAAVTALRAVDKYLHEVGKANEDASLVRGLTRF